MHGNYYWALGITVSANQQADGGVRWGASAKFYDNGLVDTEDPDAGDISTEGEIRTRRFVDSTETTDGLATAIDTVKRDAERLGITFEPHDGSPMLYVRGDGEWPDVWLPANWQERLTEQAERLEWRTYRHRSGTETSR